MIPPREQIDRVIADTGMGEMQAINHLRQRAQLQRWDTRRQLPPLGTPREQAERRRTLWERRASWTREEREEFERLDRAWDLRERRKV